VPELRSSAAERHRNRLERATAPGPGDGPLGDAHRALEESITGSPRAEVRALVDRAWAGGKLLDLELVDGIGWQLALAALLFADELERALELCDAVQSGAPATLHREASSYRAWLLFEQGRVDEAATAARHGFEAPPGRWRTHFVTAQGVLAGCQVHQGELDAAERTLAIIREPAFENSLRYPFLLEARAQLRLAQHRPEEARADALEAGQRLDATFGEAGPGTLAWRSTAAFALIAMSEPDQARDLAQAELELAEQQSLIRVVMRDLRVLGLVAGGREGLELIGRAVEIGRGGPSRLEYLHALVDYGAALRRANRRAAAREPLRDALDRSLRAGAGALAERAREELAATGSRPRTEVRSGLESLTPSERRVAELAADGLTTRQVAETLFVSRKTVEFHLRQIYRKLSVKSRPQLAETMREQAA
jgi:ATP/maltotriose-dependent transcriptional regulator MalT